MLRMLKGWVKSWYYRLLGPLYRRIQNETRAELVRMNHHYLEFHAQLTTKVADEFVAALLKIEKLERELAELKSPRIAA